MLVHRHPTRRRAHAQNRYGGGNPIHRHGPSPMASAPAGNTDRVRVPSLYASGRERRAVVRRQGPRCSRRESGSDRPMPTDSGMERGAMDARKPREYAFHLLAEAGLLVRPMRICRIPRRSISGGIHEAHLYMDRRRVRDAETASGRAGARQHDASIAALAGSSRQAGSHAGRIRESSL